LPRVSTPAPARSAKAAQSDGRRHSVRAVAIGASLLSTLGKFGGNATLSELAATAHLPLSKAHRYLRALIDSAFVEQDAAGNYRLGSEALALGLAALAGIDLVALATPLIADLSALVNETIVLSIWANHGATVVHVKEPPRRVTVVTRIGSVLPLLTSATGLVFAAYLPAEEIEAMKSAEIDAIPHGRGGAAKQAAAMLAKRLRDVRATGVAAVQSLLFPGIDAIAAPAFAANGRVAAVITVLGPTTSFDASTDGRIARAVTSTASLLSSRLGYAVR
jgi:DNA-binding IclR family transcriptional regulator